MTLARPELVMLSAFASGCVIGSERWPRPSELDPAWLVDRTRILAIRAEPPEIAPGERATFEALVPSPREGDDPSIVWLACPPEEEGGIGFGCSLDLAGIDVEDASPEELAEIGFIGFEPFLPPVWVAPADLLEPVEDEAARREGVQVLVQVSALPVELLEDPTADIDFNQVEVGYKRLVVSEATTPNHNPTIAAFTVDGIPVSSDAIVHLDPNQRYELGVDLTADTIETYEYLTSAGELEDRVEEPYVTWYATDGIVEEAFTLHPYLQSTWISPSRSETGGMWYAVLRDRRGGMSWWVQPWVVH